MKAVFLTITLLISCVSSATVLDPALDNEWNNYKISHRKDYAENELVRRIIWEANMRYINQHNVEAKNGGHNFTLGMNKFGDMTSEEFAKIYNGYKASKNSQTKLYKYSGFQIPSSVDWRKEGYVSAVKDQGNCGSCWAFSAVAALEGQHFKMTGNILDLSEQNLIDCSEKQGNHGCKGGTMDNAFNYVQFNGGIDQELAYPYTAKEGSCHFNPLEIGAHCTDHVDIERYSEKALTEALATVGPISVAIDASQPSFQLYKSGVYDEPKCSSYVLDHGVTAVGYGSESDGDYYIVKNSWGVGWGLQGYVLMSRNRDNQCGIATEASYPEAMH